MKWAWAEALDQRLSRDCQWDCVRFPIFGPVPLKEDFLAYRVDLLPFQSSDLVPSRGSQNQELDSRADRPAHLLRAMPRGDQFLVGQYAIASYLSARLGQVRHRA